MHPFTDLLVSYRKCNETIFEVIQFEDIYSLFTNYSQVIAILFMGWLGMLSTVIKKKKKKEAIMSDRLL